ncbi:SMC family ATPase [Arcanobacterium canis]|uniref:Nuclease SbcCD subunit C n=1 Tax=Arcanobacterium canis TaxID=999183 RepID=A0ABY8FXJ1_9ACTO|nr:SMC family ATPase [Arcanobacterium canis]WFM83067.1 SMC family ATPase [Arcanobacterium canis]
MKLLRLEFCGIGPFGGHQVIDFTSLTSDGLFLLEGPTGSGKSTIIDAVVYALYGDVASNDSTKERVRSSHALSDVESYIDLVFEVASGIYRVRRTPPWQRPKARGTGYTTVNSSAQLWRMSQAAVDEGHWQTGQALAAKARETGEELKAILGLTREQFVQTVVLPQGKFAQFLRLKSQERSELLESLFGTADYQKLADKLAKDSRMARSAVDEARRRFITSVETWRGNAGVQEWTHHVGTLLEQIVDETDESVLNVMADVEAELSTQYEEAKTVCEKLTEDETAARAYLAQATALRSLLLERSQLLERRDDLDQRRPVIDKFRSQIAAHQRAVVPANRLDEVTTTQKDVQKARQTCYEAWDNTSRADLAAKFDSASGNVDTLIELAQSALSESEKCLQSLDAQFGSAQQIVQLEDSVPVLVAKRQQAEIEREQALDDLDVARRKKESLPQLLEKLTSKRTQIHTITETIPQLEARVAELVTLDQIAHEVLELRRTESEDKKDASATLAAVTAAIEDEAKITAEWIGSSAAQIAQHLHDHSPCPVCGSLEHPDPAPASAVKATLDQVQAASDRTQEARTRSDQARSRLVATRTKLNEMVKRLGNETVDTIADSLKKTQDALDDACRAKASADRIEEQISKIHQDSDTLAQTISVQEALIASTSERIAGVSEQINSHKERIQEALAAHNAKDARSLMSLLRSERDKYSLANSTTQELLTLASHLLSSQRRAEQALQEAKMSANEVTEAILSAHVLTDFTEQVASFEQEDAKILGRLESEDLAQLDGSEDPQVELAQEAFDRTHAQLIASNERAVEAKRNLCDAHAHLMKAQKAHAQWATEAQKAGPIVRLSHLANADDESSRIKIPLGVWVLLRRFEVVVERANEHLAIFSRGRYELIRVDEGEKGRKLGLGIAVIDHEGSEGGDVQRAPSSLSGGETFFTSLALALALAEVVQEENGGVHIDTLMIDEGFGTLSADVRDVVMQTLTQLTDDGRTVGIVSHVEDLKSMIPQRVTVIPSERGSTLRQIS